MATTHNPYDVIVVGGGLAGLATAALLAHQGVQVLVLEKHSLVGGRAMVIQQHGFTMNYGLHYILQGYNSPHYRILQSIGKAKTVSIAPVDTSKLFRMRDGQVHLVPTSLPAMLSTHLLSRQGKAGLFKALLAIMTANAETLWDIPLGTWLKRAAPEPSLYTFFLDLVGPLTFEPEPGLLSAAHFLRVVRPMLTPKGPIAIYPAGGWQGLFEAYQACIEEHGGEVRLNSKVETLLWEEDCVVGVITKEGQLLHAKKVVLAMPPKDMVQLTRALPISELAEERLKQIRPTMGIAVDLGVRGIQNDSIAALELPELNGTMGCHDLFVPSLAPSGSHLFQFLRFLKPEQIQNQQEAVAQTETQLLETLEQIWPDLRKNIVVKRTLVRPLLTATSFRYDQGRSALLPLDIAQRANIYLVGDAIGSPGALSNIVGESAIACARLIATHLKKEARQRTV